MHPDHDTAARLAREWADGTPEARRTIVGTLGAGYAALLKAYAQRERMREVLESCPAPAHYGHWDPGGNAGRTCPACAERTAWDERRRAALALTDPSAEASRG